MTPSSWLAGSWPAVRTAVLVLAASVLAALGVNALRPEGLQLFGPTGTTTPAVRSLDLAELRRHLSLGTAVLVDVRSPKDYAAGHVTGALNIPAAPQGAYLSRVLEWLSPDELVILYCQSPTCGYSRDLAEVLLGHGFLAERIRIFEGGWQELESAPGIPVVGARP